MEEFINSKVFTSEELTFLLDLLKHKVMMCDLHIEHLSYKDKSLSSYAYRYLVYKRSLYKSILSKIV